MWLYEINDTLIRTLMYLKLDTDPCEMLKIYIYVELFRTTSSFNHKTSFVTQTDKLPPTDPDTLRRAHTLTWQTPNQFAC